MVEGRKVGVVLPAYNAERTLERTWREIPRDIVDEVILVDDCSRDNTVLVAKKLGIQTVICHDKTKAMEPIRKPATRKPWNWVMISS